MGNNILYIVWNVSPEIFSIGDFPIRWYSILFGIGIYPIGYFLMKYIFRKEKLSAELLDPLLFYIFLGTIIGARLGHCLFYAPEYYFSSWKHFMEIFMPWNGGLASHGGAIGVLIAIYLYIRKYGRKNHFDIMWLLDRICIPVCIAACLIRIGNFFNSEIYGNFTSMPWGVVFIQAGETMPRHPTQIYEALSYLTIGIILYSLYIKMSKRLYKGVLFSIFITLLFSMRFIIEFIKEPQVRFEQNMVLDMGQLLSIPFIIAGIVILIYSLKVQRPLSLK